MIVAFTGGRDYRNVRMVEAIMDLLLCCQQGFAQGLGEELQVRVGDCPTGLDAIVRAMPFDCIGKAWVADWSKHGKAAGPIRNNEMLRGLIRNEGRADLLIAFPGGKGTADCVAQARSLGIAVIEVPA